MANPTLTTWPGLLAALTVAASAAGLTATALLTHEQTPQAPPVTATVSGSGSSAQQGAMDAWRAEFRRVHPELRVDYRPTASGAGIAEFVAGGTAFAGSDVVMDPHQQALADRRCRGRAVNLPMVIGPVALAYNLPSVPRLRLSPATLTGIFSGRVTRWDAPQIAAENPGVLLPHRPIRHFHRSDDSGTSHNLTSYLRAAGGWPYRPSSRWTGSGAGVKGSGGIAAAVAQTEGSIGYMEYGFAGDARLRTASLRNPAGEFVALSPESAGRALDGARVSGYRGGLVVTMDQRARTRGAYPLVLITYEIFCSGRAGAPARAFLDYTASDAGQSYLALCGYAPLPQDLLTRVRARLGVTG